MAERHPKSTAIGRGEGMSEPTQDYRIERIEERQRTTDATLSELVSTVSTLAESHKLAQDDQRREREQYRKDHAETHKAIRELSSATTDALTDIRDRIGQTREGNPAQVRWAVGMAWAISVVLVGWGASETASNRVNGVKIDVIARDVAANAEDIKRVEHQSEDRFNGTRGNALEQRVTRLEAQREKP